MAPAEPNVDRSYELQSRKALSCLLQVREKYRGRRNAQSYKLRILLIKTARHRH